MQANEGGWLHRLPAFSVTLAQIHKSKRKQPQLHSIQVLREVCLELGRGRQPRKRTNTSHASLVYRESSKTAGLHRETLSRKTNKHKQTNTKNKTKIEEKSWERDCLVWPPNAPNTDSVGEQAFRHFCRDHCWFWNVSFLSVLKPMAGRHIWARTSWLPRCAAALCTRFPECRSGTSYCTITLIPGYKENLVTYEAERIAILKTTVPGVGDLAQW